MHEPHSAMSSKLEVVELQPTRVRTEHYARTSLMLPQWTNQVRDLAWLPRWYVTSRTEQLRCQKASIASSPWKSACSTLLEPCHERSFGLYAEGSIDLPPDWVYLLQNLTERPQRPINVEYPFCYLPLSSSTTSTTPTVSTAASTNLAQPPSASQKKVWVCWQ